MVPYSTRKWHFPLTHHGFAFQFVQGPITSFLPFFVLSLPPSKILAVRYSISPSQVLPRYNNPLSLFFSDVSSSPFIHHNNHSPDIHFNHCNHHTYFFLRSLLCYPLAAFFHLHIASAASALTSTTINMYPYNVRGPLKARPQPPAADNAATLDGDARSANPPGPPPATDNRPQGADNSGDNADHSSHRPAAPEAGTNTNDSEVTLVERSRLQRIRDRIFRRRNQRGRRRIRRADDPQYFESNQTPQENDEDKFQRLRRWARRFSLKEASNDDAQQVPQLNSSSG